MHFDLTFFAAHRAGCESAPDIDTPVAKTVSALTKAVQFLPGDLAMAMLAMVAILVAAGAQPLLAGIACGALLGPSMAKHCMRHIWPHARALRNPSALQARSTLGDQSWSASLLRCKTCWRLRLLLFFDAACGGASRSACIARLCASAAPAFLFLLRK